MFERFTDQARTVVVLAQEQARSLSHNYIGTEHLLLGLLAEGNGVAAKVLEAAGITLDVARADVVRIVGTAGSKRPPAACRSRRGPRPCSSASLRESLRLGHEHIGTEHILLGIVDEGAGLASQILVSHGFSPEVARAAVLREIGSTGATLRSRAGVAVRRSARASPAAAEHHAGGRRDLHPGTRTRRAPPADLVGAHPPGVGPRPRQPGGARVDVARGRARSGSRARSRRPRRKEPPTRCPRPRSPVSRASGPRTTAS